MGVEIELENELIYAYKKLSSTLSLSADYYLI